MKLIFRILCVLAYTMGMIMTTLFLIERFGNENYILQLEYTRLRAGAAWWIALGLLHSNIVRYWDD